MSNKRNCLICNIESNMLMNDTILGKYKIDYYLCLDCKCIFTEEPYWLEEAYKNPIVVTDTGIMERNLAICDALMKIFNHYFNENVKVLDYAGGYGILTRLLRDRGVDAYWHDIYTTNLLARGFEYDGKSKVDVILAFEVLEHLPNPLEAIIEIMSKTDCFVFSTQFLDKYDYKSNKDWWYFIPESGQHIFFLSNTAIKKLATLINCNYTTVNGLHILYRNIEFKAIEKNSKIKDLMLRVSNKIQNHYTVPSKFKSKVWDDHLLMKSKMNTNENR